MVKTHKYNWQVITVVIAGVVIGSAFFIVKVLNVNPLSSSAANPYYAPTLQIVSPSGESLTPGVQYTIHWTHTVGPVPQEVLIYLMQGNTYYYTIANTVTSSPGNNYYNWTVPAGFNGENFKIKIITQNSYSGDIGPVYYRYTFSYPFIINRDELSITPPNLTLKTPVGDESYSFNQVVPIAWDQSDDTTEPVYAKISLRKGGAIISEIATVASVKGINQYDWTVPSKFEGKGYQIHIYLNRRWPSPHNHYVYSRDFYISGGEWVDPR